MKLQDKAQSIKDLALKTKDNFTLRQLVMVCIVLFGTVANIAMDYLTIGFDAGIFMSPAYWINLAMGQSAIIMIMLCVYSFMADREENSNPEIQQMRNQLAAAHFALSEYALSRKFDDYVYIKNRERKIRAYRVRMERKIFKAKTDEKRKELQEQLDKGLASIEYLRVKYDKIHIVEIFSHAELTHTDDKSMSAHSGRTTAKMLRNKVLGIVAFGVLLGSMAFDSRAFGWGLLVNSFIKLFQAAYAVYAGGSTGIRFARGSLLSALENRAGFVQQFIEANRPNESELNRLKAEKERKRAEEEQEALTKRNALVAAGEVEKGQEDIQV